MKHVYQLIALALAFALGLGSAFGQPQQVEISRLQLGSGEPGLNGFENAIPVFENVYHAPQYLPGSPTAASIWPRVVEVLCRPAGQRLQCDGYHWTPRMGRGEYLYFQPVMAPVPVAAAAPVPVPPQSVAPVAALPPERPPEPAAAVAEPSPPERPARPRRPAGRQDRQ